MKKASELKNDDYSGFDTSFEISLFEYGYVFKRDENELKIWYNVGMSNCSDENEDHKITYFDHCRFALDLDLKREFSWIDENDWPQFLSYLGENDFDHWNKNPLECKIRDLISYYGYENVCGTAYYPIEIFNNLNGEWKEKIRERISINDNAYRDKQIDEDEWTKNNMSLLEILNSTVNSTQ